MYTALKGRTLHRNRWGQVYYNGADLHEVIVEAFSAFASSNPIHPDVFPTCRKMEAEVVALSLTNL